MWLERVQGLLELKKDLMASGGRGLSTLIFVPSLLFFAFLYFFIASGFVFLPTVLVRSVCGFVLSKFSEGLFTACLVIFTWSIITILLWAGGLFWGGVLTSSCIVTRWQPSFLTWVDSSYGFFRLLLRYRVRCFYEFSFPVLWFSCILFQLKLSSASPDGSALLFCFFSFYEGLLGFSFLRTTCKFAVLS